MKWPGRNFHLENGPSGCGMDANASRGTMLRMSVRDAHTVEVCASEMRSALSTEKVNASNMAHTIGSNYYGVFTSEMNKTHPLGTSPSRGTCQP